MDSWDAAADLNIMVSEFYWYLMLEYITLDDQKSVSGRGLHFGRAQIHLHDVLCVF